MKIKHILTGIIIITSFSCYNALDEVYREANLNPASLSSLEIFPGSISPKFRSDTTSYSVSVPNEYTTVKIIPVALLSDAVLQYCIDDGVMFPCTSGSYITVDELEVGTPKVVSITVAVSDGKVERAYTISVTRQGAGDASLRSLTISAGSLSPAFLSGTLSYNLTVPTDFTSVTITPLTNSDKATLRYRIDNGSWSNYYSRTAAIASGTLPAPNITKVIEIEVRAENQNDSKKYTVNIIRYRTWKSAVIIDAENYTANDPRIALDNNSNAIAIWSHTNPSEYSSGLFARTFSNSWGEIVQLQDYLGYYTSFSHDIAMDINGSAMVIWTHGRSGSGMNYTAKAKRYNKTISIWETTYIISSTLQYIVGSQIIFNNPVNAIAVWTQSGSSGNDIYSNNFNGISWAATMPIDFDTTGAAVPQITSLGNSSALAVWVQNGSIYANRFNGTSWDGATDISIGTTSPTKPQIASAGNGTAMVVWMQDNDIWARVYSGGWGNYTTIDYDGNPATDPQIAYSANGTAIAVWVQNNNIYARRYDGYMPGSAAAIDYDTTAATVPQIAMDSSGRAIAVWVQNGNIYANRFNGTSWEGAVAIDNDSNAATVPQIAMNSSGSAVVVWVQNGNIYASWFD